MFSLLNLLQFKSTRHLRLASGLSKCHYTYARNFFLFAFALSMSREMFGETIVCYTAGDSISLDYLHTYCFVNGTFTTDDHQIVYHDYYQWVSLLLLVEAFVFYVPFHIWKGYVEPDVEGLVVRKENDVARVVEAIIRGSGFRLYLKNFILETIYGLQLLLNAALVYVYFFRANGVLNLDRLFPFAGTCHLNFYSGGGGGITTGKYSCLLPLNVLYRKLWVVVVMGFAVLFAAHCYYWTKRLIVAACRPSEVNRWWAYRLAEKNTQGQSLWDLRKEARSILLWKPTETNVEAINLSLSALKSRSFE